MSALQVWNDQMVFEHLVHSKLPRQDKSLLRHWFDKATDGRVTAKAEEHGIVSSHVFSAVEALRGGGEGGALGFGFGVLSSMKLLDIGGIPVDGVTAGLALLASIGLSHTEIGTDFRNIGIAAVAVYGFRKGEALFSEKKLQVSGEEAATGEDPIVAAGNKL